MSESSSPVTQLMSKKLHASLSVGVDILKALPNFSTSIYCTEGHEVDLQTAYFTKKYFDPKS